MIYFIILLLVDVYAILIILTSFIFYFCQNLTFLFSLLKMYWQSKKVPSGVVSIRKTLMGLSLELTRTKKISKWRIIFKNSIWSFFLFKRTNFEYLLVFCNWKSFRRNFNLWERNHKRKYWRRRTTERKVEGREESLFFYFSDFFFFLFNKFLSFERKTCDSVDEKLKWRGSGGEVNGFEANLSIFISKRFIFETWNGLLPLRRKILFFNEIFVLLPILDLNFIHFNYFLDLSVFFICEIQSLGLVFDLYLKR